MPILAAAVASLLLAWLRGAPPTRLAGLRLRWMPLPLIAFLTQLAVFIRLPDVLAPVAPFLHLVTLALLLLFVGLNLRYRSLALVGIGVALNAAVIAANGGYMPVRPTDMVRIGFPHVAARLEAGERYQKSVALDETTRLPWLGDVIHLPLPGPGPDRMISAGDLFVALGTFLFIQEALVSRAPRTLPPD